MKTLSNFIKQAEEHINAGHDQFFAENYLDVAICRYKEITDAQVDSRQLHWLGEELKRIKRKLEDVNNKE